MMAQRRWYTVWVGPLVLMTVMMVTFVAVVVVASRTEITAAVITED